MCNGYRFIVSTVGLFYALCTTTASGESLEALLLRQPPAELAAEAHRAGDAARGAIVFFQHSMVCSKCHSVSGDPTNASNALGPDLTSMPQPLDDAALVEAVLQPSKVVRKGFETATVVTADGGVLTGLLVERTDQSIALRDASGKLVRVAADEVEQFALSPQSLMPAGQVNQLSSRQQFLDLIRYLFEIRDGGPKRARELQPSEALLTLKLPEYESNIDHAGLIRSWNNDSLTRGEAIYQRVCANCHGTATQAGSLPTALRFGEGTFKNGSDPLAMYNTLTRGFGFMAAQTWMVPSQKYDVIHYIRESYLRKNKQIQLSEVNSDYLASLPAGNTRGPEPSNIEAWSAMDYGPHLTHAFKAPGRELNYAYKGIAIRLDPGAGGVARGSQWMLFDTDTLRVAAAWQAPDSDSTQRFIDWRGIQFNGQHGISPTIVGDVSYVNSIGPGWAHPETGSTTDDQRVQGRDGRRYGPLPRNWAKFRGLAHYDSKVILHYTVGNTEVLEMPGLVTPPEVTSVVTPAATPPSNPAATPTPLAAYRRSFNIGPRDRELVLQIAETEISNLVPLSLEAEAGLAVALFDPQLAAEEIAGDAAALAAQDKDRGPAFVFDGKSYLEADCHESFNVSSQDFTIAARIKTKQDGTIFAITERGPKWIPNGVALFIRDGRLSFDIGWVGAIESRMEVADGAWHEVALSWNAKSNRARLIIDGQADRAGTLAVKAPLKKAVARIGYTSPNFPAANTAFQGEIAEVIFAQESVEQPTVDLIKQLATADSLVARWLPSTATAQGAKGQGAKDHGSHKFDAVVRTSAVGGSEPGADRTLMAGVLPATVPVKFEVADGHLRLRIPAGSDPLQFSLWTTALPNALPAAQEQVTATERTVSQTLSKESLLARCTDLARSLGSNLLTPATDLSAMMHGAAPRWPQQLETPLMRGPDSGPLAVDTLSAPESNPWLALTRFTGLDFLSDGRIAACTWDGDVWLARIDEAAEKISWRRIASGMYQPLGIKAINDRLYVTCRDQLTVLHDRNGDEEIDYYECFNNDHQVTEHFHEFAMGLQVDASGNFYYAKSARHALPAVVPHHGTLLRVSPDGQRTDIIANGFRAANGVCLNPDGSFVVTDQEGHWNPKNRINWVTLDRPESAKVGAVGPPAASAVGSQNGPAASAVGSQSQSAASAVGSQIRPKFYGNMFGYHDVTDASDSAMVPPLCWITNAFDRSPAELLWVDSPRWGPLNGSLLNLSYGYGKVFLVQHETVAGLHQGGMIELPIPAFPTGVMRGRFHPADEQLYLCGMFSWAGNATHPGGLYRVRATGQPIVLPKGLEAKKAGMVLEFTEPLDASSIVPESVAVQVWSLQRSANYGSKHFDERELAVQAVKLLEDGKRVELTIPDIAPTWCMEIRYQFRTASGQPATGVIHNTIHNLQ